MMILKKLCIITSKGLYINKIIVNPENRELKEETVSNLITEGSSLVVGEYKVHLYEVNGTIIIDNGIVYLSDGINQIKLVGDTSTLFNGYTATIRGELFNNNGTLELTDIDIEEVKIADDTVLTWGAEEGDNLRELLTKWSAMSGWKLLWNTNRNYVLSAGVMFKGKFADVSSALIRAFARARPAPIATYYKGNRVIVVETMENENAY